MSPKARPKRVKYTAKQLQECYQAWSRLDPEKIDLRTAAWHRYCDVRDGLPLGTSAKVYVYGDQFLGHAAAGLHDD
jgi:hypothetical protein